VKPLRGLGRSPEKILIFKKAVKRVALVGCGLKAHDPYLLNLIFVKKPEKSGKDWSFFVGLFCAV